MILLFYFLAVSHLSFSLLPYALYVVPALNADYGLSARVCVCECGQVPENCLIDMMEDQAICCCPIKENNTFSGWNDPSIIYVIRN